MTFKEHSQPHRRTTRRNGKSHAARGPLSHPRPELWQLRRALPSVDPSTATRYFFLRPLADLRLPRVLAMRLDIATIYSVSATASLPSEEPPLVGVSPDPRRSLRLTML